MFSPDDANQGQVLKYKFSVATHCLRERGRDYFSDFNIKTIDVIHILPITIYIESV